MSEPAITSNYALPRQMVGQGDRVRVNGALDRIDTILAILAGAINVVGLNSSRVVVHGPYVAQMDGETDYAAPNPYGGGARRLLAMCDGLVSFEGVHWNFLDPDTVRFSIPRLAGERIVFWDIGFASGIFTPIMPPGSSTVLFTWTEVPTGAINSTTGSDGNGVFTLTHPIAANTVPRVLINDNLVLRPDIDYTWSLNTIQFVPGAYPIVGEIPSVTYEWQYS